LFLTVLNSSSEMIYRIPQCEIFLIWIFFIINLIKSFFGMFEKIIRLKKIPIFGYLWI